MLSRIDRYFKEVICTICLTVMVGPVLLHVILRYFFPTATGRISKITIEDISVGVPQLLIPYILMILIMVFFPNCVIWLPDLVKGPQRR